MQDLSEKILDPFLTDDEKRENVFDIPENLMREALKKVFSSDLNIETLIEIYDSCQPSTHPYAGAPASDFINCSEEEIRSIVVNYIFNNGNNEFQNLIEDLGIEYLDRSEIDSLYYNVRNQFYLSTNEVEELENGQYIFHSFRALKNYCDSCFNDLNKVILGEEITVLEDLFRYSERTNEQFAGIENWDVSNVTDMNGMFCFAENFNQPIGNWDVSKVENMECMFSNAITFNQPLNNWNVSKVTDMHAMFFLARNFNQPLKNWDVSKVEKMGCMFHYAERFNQPLDKWDVSKVKDMENMFCHAEDFNQPLNNWDLSRDPDGAEDLEKYRQSKGQVVEQKKKSVHR